MHNWFILIIYIICTYTILTFSRKMLHLYCIQILREILQQFFKWFCDTFMYIYTKKYMKAVYKWILFIRNIAQYTVPRW